MRRAILAQDGHSLGEQALYEALWKTARPYNDRARVITVGYRGMAELVRLTVNNCKANILALANKLAVEEISPYTHSQARTYLIYSFPAILDRRQAAGLTHYIKTRGVVFVDPESGKHLNASAHKRTYRDTVGIPEAGIPLPGGPETGIPETGVPLSLPLSQLVETGIPDSGDSGTPDLGTLNTRNHNLEMPLSSSSAAEFPSTRQALTLFPDIHPNDQDILDLVQRCKAVCADTQDAEIAHFVRLKGSTLKTGAIKTSRMALLLKIVPQCLTGETLKLYRKRKLDGTESQRAQEVKQLAEREQMDRFWEETLRDPKQTPDSKRSAMGYFVGIIERVDAALERRTRAEEVVRRFRGADGIL
jgi:hypothetical protein